MNPDVYVTVLNLKNKFSLTDVGQEGLRRQFLQEAPKTEGLQTGSRMHSRFYIEKKAKLGTGSHAWNSSDWDAVLITLLL